MNCKISKRRFKREKIGFAQVGIEEPDKLYNKFSETGPLFVAKGEPDCYILNAMKMYKEKLVVKKSKEPKGYLVLRK